MNKRSRVINTILERHPNAFVFLSNGLTSREAAHFTPNERCFYLLHGMGEALSVGIGFALAQPNIEVIVIEGDGSALMGLASWSLMPVSNLSYYILANGVHETTGGQKLYEFPFIPEWCHICEIGRGQEKTPNPPSPQRILDQCKSWLDRNLRGT